MKAVFMGSFQPVTNGHVDIITRASRLCDEVFAVVGYNPEKPLLVPVSARERWLKQISKSTVYRNLDKLCESGALLRIPVPGGALHVDHTLTSHYHMYCKVCGNLYDIEAAGIGDLKNEVTVSNGCEITDCYIVFSGTCPECNKADKN